MIWEPLLISLRVAVSALVVVTILGIFLARLFTEKQFPGKDRLEAVLLLPMVLPPTIIGYGLLMLLGRNGPLGGLIFRVTGQTIVFTWWAGVVASSVVALPLMYQSLRGGLLGVNPEYLAAARTMGLSENRIFWRVRLPLAWHGLRTGMILSFARALGEFGATLMIAGNIPGRTQTIPVAMYFAVEAGNYRSANILMALIVSLSLGMVWLMNRRREDS